MNNSPFMKGEDPTPGAQPPAMSSPWAPLVERVGVPLLWIAVGYGLCKLTQKPRGGNP